MIGIKQIFTWWNKKTLGTFFKTLFFSNGDTLSNSHFLGSIISSMKSLPMDILKLLNSLANALMYFGAKYNVDGVIE